MFPISEWEEQYGVNEFSFRLYTGEMSQTYLDAFCKKFYEEEPDLLDAIFLHERQWTFTREKASPTEPFLLQGMSILSISIHFCGQCLCSRRIQSPRRD